MSSSDTPRRVRTKVCAVKITTPPTDFRNDPYFSEKKRDKRFAKFTSRIIADRRWLSFGWLASEGFTFQNDLISQNLRNLCEFHHQIYSDCVREFYANFRRTEDGYQSWVRNVHFFIKPEDLCLLYGLRNEGLCLSDDDDDTADILDVDPKVVYYETLKDKAVAGKSGRSIGHMNLNDRLLFWTLCHVLTPKSGNFGYPTDVDLKYMFAIKQEIQVNWVKVILHQMLRVATSTGSGKLPFSMLISQLLVMKNVPTPIHDRFEDLAKDCCLNSDMLKKSEIVKHASKGWMSRLDYVATVAAEDENAEEPSQNRGKAPMETDDFDLRAELTAMESRLKEHIDHQFETLRADLKLT